jgi:hypothetical protein
MADEHVEQSHNGGGGYEHKDADARIIVYSTLGLIVSLVVVCFIVVGIFKAMQDEMPRPAPISRVEDPNRLPPEPRLQPFPANQLGVLRQHEDDVLDSYGWVDQKAGVVHIPVDKAMDIMAQRGFPVKSEQTAGNANTTSK